MSDAPDLSPQEAVDRWLDRASLDRAAQTIAGYRGQLRHFVRWANSEGIDSVAQLDPWDIETFETHRRGNDLAAITLRNELGTLRQLLDYCARIGVVDDELPESIELPKVSADDQTDETILEPHRAKSLLDVYRNGDEDYPRGHAFLELAWYTGARMGGLRGLDLGDVDFQEGFVRFRHRPETGTPLKNAYDGERVVGISQPVVDALTDYVAEDRPDVTDDHGRQPLFATMHGRISLNVLRTSCYYATIPCRFRSCPHGKDRDSCDWTTQADASKCPSSRSPHQIRSGSITWQLDRGLRADVVAERVNASVEIIEQHYDQASDLAAYERRREKHLSKLGFQTEDDNEEETA
ncbi:tyrosine-type recombinase/integrase [Halohasta salina]|uniref:tyrosine-type recombinase/integrase n=1 Tax=Halohasta salina TaxID=2961621 RepID=UPI0020A3B258|nr:site-specific integrase [Halohasta salina]